MAGLIILEVERRVHKREVREQALGAHAAGQAEQVVVRIARVIADALLHAEDLDREDRRLALAQAALGHQQQVAHDHAPLRGGIHAVVDRGERRLRARAGMHGVQVVDERLHRLIGATLRLAVAAVDRVAHDAVGRLAVGHLKQAAAQLVFKRLVGLERRHEAGFRLDLAQQRLRVVVAGMVHEHQVKARAQRAAVLLDVGLRHARGHVIVEAGNRLAAVLVVLVGLDRDARQRGIAADVLRLAQHAVAGREAARKQLRQVDLRAGRRQRQEVEVMDVNVSLAVRPCMLGIEHIHVVELLRALAAVLEHRAHRGIAVNVRVLALDVGIRRVLERDVLQDVHQAGLGLPRAAALRPVENVGLGGLGVALINENLLHHVLHALDRRHVDALVAVHLARHDARQALCFLGALGAVRRLKGAQNRAGNLFFLIGDLAAVPLDDVLRHPHIPHP